MVSKSNESAIHTTYLRVHDTALPILPKKGQCIGLLIVHLGEILFAVTTEIEKWTSTRMVDTGHHYETEFRLFGTQCGDV